MSRCIVFIKSLRPGTWDWRRSGCRRRKLGRPKPEQLEAGGHELGIEIVTLQLPRMDEVGRALGLHQTCGNVAMDGARRSLGGTRELGDGQAEG